MHKNFAKLAHWSKPHRNWLITRVTVPSAILASTSRARLLLGNDKSKGSTISAQVRSGLYNPHISIIPVPDILMAEEQEAEEDMGTA